MAVGKNSKKYLKKKIKNKKVLLATSGGARNYKVGGELKKNSTNKILIFFILLIY